MKSRKMLVHRVLILLLYLVSCVVSPSCMEDRQGSCQCIDLDPPNFSLLFQRGFSDTPILVEVNEKEYFRGQITTDESIELAKLFEFSSDSIRTLAVQIGNEEKFLVCPHHVINIDYSEGDLEIRSLDKFPPLE